MTYYDRITTKLQAAFAPSELVVIDESHKHAGHLHHPGADQGGETHFRVRVVSPAFTGLSRIERHRQVNAVLADELKERVHALAIEADAP